ncbi:glycine zipper domain-containing protein [Thiocapsa sp.]|uniref:glycine zipper domain-containing protein n=1 Tax=Thiocapsa sp. TaxID=2024551 RepID=UPI0025CF1229|nr:glycine zipper domain-containing protein [Thiocapsa sp.]
MKTIAIPLILVAAAALSGCGNTTGARVGTGTALGLATGAAIGSFTAQAGAGALIGAGVGALGGYLMDEHKRGNL